MAALTKLTTNINLEMSGDTKRFLVSAKQGDKATRYIVARLLNNGEQYTIPEGARAVVNIKKPDGKHVYNTCTYSGADVTVELTNQALAAAGTAYCDIEIRSSDDAQVITSVSFTIEIEESMRNDSAILSANEFTELEGRIAGHIKNIEETDAAAKKAEAERVAAENLRVEAENKRVEAENIRQKNENTRIQQETKRQQDTSQAIENAQNATTAAITATKDCKETTEQANIALQNQEQLEATLNTATQIRQEISQMQQSVEAAKLQVEQNKQEIDEIIQNSLLESAEKILESVQNYFERAEALYSSMYLDCDGETPYLRTVTPLFIDGATPQVRSVNEGVDFDGGTPTSRLLAV
ncbi:MAG: BppU family phage baseplate upper protein [Eubacteriales bacterium]|nr:BppU family phage baseplate upper protein [Eubacteriales bacterium]